MRIIKLFFCLITKVSSLLNEPFNFHSSLAINNGITISWTTNEPYLFKPLIFYGEKQDLLLKFSFGTSLSYVKNSYHHHSTIKNVNLSKPLFFKAGDGIIMSKIKKINFVSQKNIIIYGDMGIDFANNTMKSIENDENVDLIIHLGDISYADDKGLEFGKNPYYENIYDEFMFNVERFSKLKPYMVCPGNHDISCHSITDFGCDVGFRNFSAYNSRFYMPQNGVKNMWYSFDYGPIHFVSINTETDYPNAPTNPHTLIGSGKGGDFGEQIDWLRNDLLKANKNRDTIPWIIVYGHRPMYSNILSDYPLFSKYHFRKAFENILLDNKVDIYFAGHIHSYERNDKIINGKANENGMYHITIGSAGNSEKIDKTHFFNNKFNLYSNYNDYGYGKLIIHNDTCLEWNFIVSENQNIEDKFIFIK